jgi:hypothetical protein
MRAATTSFLPRSRASSSLARKLAGPTADARRFEAACRLAAPQIDVLDIREARLPLLARALEDRVGPVSILSANEAKFRERSQRVKIQQKQSCKMNGAPSGVKPAALDHTGAHRPLGETGQRGPVDRDCDRSSAQRLADRLC